MYDISQLNDLLVPELHDIADHLNIANSKKMNKQELVSTILDKQNDMATDKTNEGEKPKRKRIAKTTEAVAPEARQDELFKKESVVPAAKKTAVAEKKPLRKPKTEPIIVSQDDDEEEELQPITSEQSTIPAAIAQMLAAEDDIQQPEVDIDDEDEKKKRSNELLP